MTGRKASANKTFKGNMIPRETPTDTNCVRTKPHSILKEYEETQCGRRRKATGSRECPLAEGLWSPSRCHVGLGTHCGEQSAWHFRQLRQEQNEIASFSDFPGSDLYVSLSCHTRTPMSREYHRLCSLRSGGVSRL